jgi:hypothetical protein
VIDAISGAIFMGVPKLQTVDAASKTLPQMLKCGMRHRRYNKADMGPNDVREIVDLCLSFDDVTFKAPVLSIFESHVTPMQRRVFAKFRKSQDEIVSLYQNLFVSDVGKIQSSFDYFR